MWAPGAGWLLSPCPTSCAPDKVLQFRVLQFTVETIRNNSSYFVEALQPALVFAARIHLGIVGCKSSHVWILDAHHNRSCFWSGESCTPHPHLALQPHTLRELPALFYLLNIGGNIVLFTTTTRRAVPF